MPVVFTDHEIKSGLKHKKILSHFLDGLVFDHRSGTLKTNLRFIFCTDAYLLEMNMQFLKHDTYTDIITFDLTERPEHLDGELYVSIERVKENAPKFKVTEQDELHRVIFHGVLHLCGFKDKKPADVAVMRQMEDRCLHQYKKLITG